MLLVVGGHSRNTGKTGVVVALIEALPDARWTAVKISPHYHQADSGANTDTARFLAAGAVRSHLIDTPEALGPILESGENVIAESNRVLDFLKPDLYLMVLDFSVLDFKESAAKRLDSVDAFVVVGRGIRKPPWTDLPAGWYERKPKFFVAPPAYMTPEVVEFVRSKAGL
jgi:hypothetical protein